MKCRTHGVSVLMPLLLLRVSALRSIGGKRCPDVVLPKMWGIWIDGRDSDKGPKAYSSNYAQMLIPALQALYNEPLEGTLQGKLNENTFLLIRILLRASWRYYENPIANEVGICHRLRLPKERVREIMSTVTVVDSGYHPRSPLGEKQYMKVIGQLFTNFTKAVGSTPAEKDVLFHLGVLLQNLAFLHPLSDWNGRSRMLLTQYILRRYDIACGTMMFNNNKNVYFDTVPELVKKIQEGVDKYNLAMESDFSINPWTKSGTVDPIQLHNQTWSKPWDNELARCFRMMSDQQNSIGTSPL